MGAQNKVVAGDFNGKAVFLESKDKIQIGEIHFPSNEVVMEIKKSTVKSYEVLDASSKKSAGSAIARAGVGALFLGPIGLAAGLSAKSKGTYTISLDFHNGKKSLIEVDDKIYKAMVKNLF